MVQTTSTDARLYTFEGGDATVRPIDPDSPQGHALEQTLRLMIEHEKDPELRESARRGLKKLEERRRNGDR